MTEDLSQLPNLSVWAYPVHSGPGALYPAEANVRPVWSGGGPKYVPEPRYAEPAEDEAQPEPEFTSLQAYDLIPEECYPSSMRSLAKAARASGWEARIGFSRGPVPGAKAGTWQTRDMIGVWVDGFGKRAVALWERNPDAEFSAKKLEAGNIKPGEIPSGMQWSTAGTSILLGRGMSWGYANLTDFKEWLALQGAVLPGWYEIIQAWVLAHEERDTRKAKTTKAPEREHA